MKVPCHSDRRGNRGSALIEIAIAYATLVTVGLLSVRAAVNTSSGQTWTIKQSMSDAYLTRETALASRVPFDDITATGTLWPLSPDVATSTVVIGKMPGGADVTAQLHRTRIPDANNLSSAGGTGSDSTNPGGTEAWKLQSLLVYTITGKDYVKTRTTLRIR